MCLLIAKPAGKKIPKDHFTQAFNRNDDGGGFAYVKDGKLLIRKPFWKVEQMWEEAEPLFDCPMIIHFRITTHGGTSAANCHPFDAGGGWAMGHNGMIPKAQPHIGESDTRAYIREFIAPITDFNPEFIQNEAVKKKMSEHISNSKLVFLNHKGEFVIVNEDKGEWEDEVWYSNCSYKTARPSRNTNYTSSGYTESGYHRSMTTYGPSKIPPYWEKPNYRIIHGSRIVSNTPKTETTRSSTIKGSLFSTEAIQFKEKFSFRCCHCGVMQKETEKIISLLDEKEEYCSDCWINDILVSLP